jgi:uncharacterized protein YdaU (DUF1376 family)
MMAAAPVLNHNLGPPLFDRHPNDRMTYVQWHIRDFLQGVRGMKPDQIGIYAIVLLLIYDSMGMLRDDDRFIAGHCQLDIRYYRRLRQQLLDAGKVYEADGYLYNNRAQAEIAKFCESAKKKREAAAVREEKKREAAAKKAAEDAEAASRAAAEEAEKAAPDAREARTGGAPEAPDARASGAPDAPIESVTCSENSEIINEIKEAPATAVAVLSTQKEKEKEKEREKESPSKSPPPWARWSDAELRGFIKRLEDEAGDGLANVAGAAGLLDCSPILSWLEGGADPEWDIVPAVRMVAARAKKSGRPIRHWSYFSQAVADCKWRRGQGLPAVEVRTKPTVQKGPADRYAGLSQEQRERIERAKAEAAGGGHA